MKSGPLKTTCLWLLLALVLPSAGLGGPMVQSHVDYSPFVLRIDGHPTFDSISFKNVSGGKPAPQADLEMMAESLALALKASHPTLLVEVVHVPEFMDPKNHLFCAERHLYVDFWGLRKSQDWGYSLWAGCGEDDRFEWRTLGPSSQEIAAQLDWVTLDVSLSLKRADQRGCYQRNC